MTEQQKNDAFDALEDALVAGLRANHEGMVHVDAVMPLMEAARAVLMIQRGVEPIMPQRRAA